MANLGLFLFVLAFMLVVIAAMSVGVIVRNKPIKGSCGGLNAVGINGDCKICGKPADQTCDWNTPDSNGSKPKAYDVMSERTDV